VDVELRYLEGCPNLTVARQRLALALGAVGHSNTDVRLRRVRTAQEAEEFGFVGSPTVLVDGVDLFENADLPAGMSCRLYRAGETMSGAPSVEELTDLLTTRLRGE
jgi:hypothetical protein